MPRRHLPALIGTLAAIAACSDPTDAGPRRFAIRIGDAGVGTTAEDRGVAVEITLVDSTTAPSRIAVTVADAAGVPLDSVVSPYGEGSSAWVPFRSVVYLGPEGRFTVTATVRDTAGRTERSTAVRTVRLAGERYAVRALPDLGADANALWIDSVGTVAGWVGAPGGGKRPAVWRGEALHVVPATDSVDVVATRVNAAGDVLLQLAPWRAVAPHLAARVRTADGREIPLGPIVAPAWDGRPLPFCCSRAADLTESRLALGAEQSPQFSYDFVSVVRDLSTGRVDTTRDARRLVNARRQALAAVVLGSGPYQSLGIIPTGLALPRLPDGLVRTQGWTCDRLSRSTETKPVDLDEDGNVLVDYCGYPAYLGQDGRRVWLDRPLGRVRAARLARRGGLVAAVDADGGLLLWRATTGQVTRVQADGAWRFDSLGTVNWRGEIAAHGVERVTGRTAALLLTPGR